MGDNMKQKEKDELLETINKLSCRIALPSFGGNIIDVITLEDVIDSIPVDDEEVTEVYAIKDLVNDEIIWSARGSAYKTMKDAKNRIARLENKNRNTFTAYKIITYKLEK